MQAAQVSQAPEMASRLGAFRQPCRPRALISASPVQRPLSSNARRALDGLFRAAGKSPDKEVLQRSTATQEASPSSQTFWAEPDAPLAVASASYDGVTVDGSMSLGEHLPDIQEEAQQPANPLLRFWNAYTKALEEKPILVKSATSFFGFLIGDTIAQSIVGHSFDHSRTLRLVAFGMFMDGPVGHVWYTVLDKMVYPNEPTSNRAVVTKMLCDQIIWAPIFSCVFFTFMNVLEGHPGNVLPAIQHKLLPLLLANYALWPVAHLINFKFVPSQQRILYINCVQILWSTYLSNLAAVKMRTR